MQIQISKIVMSIIIVLVAIVLLLLGCEKASGPPLLTECKFDTPISVMVVELEPLAMAEKWEYYNRAKLPDGAEVKGFAIYNMVTQVHTLYILKIRGQKDSYRIETLGHELMHSFCGDWHPRTIE